MKKNFLFLAFLLFVNINANAQIPVGNFTINGKIFVGFISRNLDENGIISSPNSLIIQLLNGNMNITNASPAPITRECGKSISMFYSITDVSKKLDFVAYHDIMRSVFPPARLAAIMANDGEGIKSIVFNIYPNGVIEDMRFSVHRNTIITPQEIELLYSRMKTQLVFSTSPVGCPNIPDFYVNVSSDYLQDIYTDPYYFGLGEEWDR